MRVAILGMGAIGHVVARALQGHVDLVLIDRTRSPLKVGEATVDAAVVCTKAYGTAWAGEIAAQVLSPTGVVATLQNGLGNVETLARRVDHDRVALGVIYVGAELSGGELQATGPGRVELGRPRHAGAAEHLGRLAQHMTEGGMAVEILGDPWPSVWRKLVVNAAMNPTTALFRLRNSELADHPAALPIADQLARETACVATAAGVPIDEKDAPGLWQSVAGFVNRSSMLQDVLAGRPTEIDAINGAIATEGRRLGVDAPMNEAVTTLVRALQAPRRGE